MSIVAVKVKAAAGAVAEAEDVDVDTVEEVVIMAVVDEAVTTRIHGNAYNRNHVIIKLTVPDKGGKLASRTLNLVVNHFPVTHSSSNVILHYNIDVKQEGSQDNKSATNLTKDDLHLIREKSSHDQPDLFPLLDTAYDGGKNIFSAPNIALSSEPANTDPKLKNITEYQKLIRKFIYLTTTRPDIAYTVSCLGHFMHNPLKSHLDIA
ncbi:ribonuclease H-like domain-containing protein [Tanacetum coccineum]